MNEPTIEMLQREVYTRSYYIDRKFDGVKGICTVTLKSKDGGTVFTNNNRSKMTAGQAYKTALHNALTDIKNLENAR